MQSGLDIVSTAKEISSRVLPLPNGPWIRVISGVLEKDSWASRCALLKALVNVREDLPFIARRLTFWSGEFSASWHK